MKVRWLFLYIKAYIQVVYVALSTIPLCSNANKARDTRSNR